MRVVVFGDDQRVGVWEGDRIVDLNRADPALPSDLEAFIAAGDAALERVTSAIARAAGGPASFARDRVRLRAPAVRRPRIGCAAGNYAEHTLGSARRKGESSALGRLGADAATLSAEELTAKTRETERPRGFWKDFAVPIGPEDDVIYPARAEQFDYEGEVAAVIGRSAKDVAKGQGKTYIWGVTLLNDWSIRGQNVKDSLSFNLGKNFDGGASVGPCILVGGDPADLVVETRVNGELRQHYNSGDMIAGGSGPGSATDSAKEGKDLWLKPGDVVEVSSPEIGTLRNRVVAKR